MDIIVIGLLLILIWRSKIIYQFNEEYLSLKTCNSWKAFFAIAVIFHHIAQRSGSGRIFQIFEFLGFGIVSVFFFISAYGLQKKYMIDNNYKKTFLLKRIPTILVPYIIITFVYWVFYAIDGQVFTIKDMYYQIINGSPLVANSWFVFNILAFYIFFYLLMRIFNKNYFGMIIGGVTFCIAWFGICNKLGVGYWIYNVTPVLVLGMIWATYEEKIINFIKNNYMIVTAIVWSAFLFGFISKKGIELYVNFNTINLLAAFVESVLFVISIVLVSMKFKVGNKLLENLSEISFEIYLFHGLVMLLLRNDVIYINSDIVYTIIVLISTILGAQLIHLISKYILDKNKTFIEKYICK